MNNSRKKIWLKRNTQLQFQVASIISKGSFLLVDGKVTHHFYKVASLKKSYDKKE